MNQIEIAPILGEVYWFWKDSEAEKEELRKQFFDACTEGAKKLGLAQRTVMIPDDISPGHSEEYAEKYNAGWKAIRVSEDSKRVLIEEDPQFKSATEVVLLDEPVEDRKGKLHPGYVVSKTIVGGSTLVDSDRLIEVDPDLYDQVTEWKGFPGVDARTNPALDEALENMNWDRVVKSDLSLSEVEELKPYVYEGPRQIRLNVSYAKDDETPRT